MIIIRDNIKSIFPKWSLVVRGLYKITKDFAIHKNDHPIIYGSFRIRGPRVLPVYMVILFKESVECVIQHIEEQRFGLSQGFQRTTMYLQL